jgi:bacillithiol biosynthesis cysteine-adding enzyme BshC
VITTIELRELPAIAGNKLYLDYVAGRGEALGFYSHSPSSFEEALKARKGYRYPRQEVVRLLTTYNARLGAHTCAMENIAALDSPAAFCVVSGQQAGFLGGPAYTAYKIVTSIRLAEHLAQTLSVRVVPIFWLASEDHDFGEVNHADLLRDDGQVGRVSFRWHDEGRPIADLPLTKDVKQAYDTYFQTLPQGPFFSQVKEWFDPTDKDSYVEWDARVWARLFSQRGLVLVEPRTLRPPAGDFIRFALGQSEEIRRRLDEVSQRLTEAGYRPALDSEQAGYLYTFDQDGRRVRVSDPGERLAQSEFDPRQYSTDAALRPLFADAMLPVIASVLGPGETAYQGMLRPLYDLFEVPQPVLFPRKSYTVADQRQVERLAQYGTTVAQVLTEQMDADEVFSNLVPAAEEEMFDSASRDIQAALAPLRDYLADIDPSLERTWTQTLINATRNLDKLKERAIRARLGRQGLSKGNLQGLKNALLPKGLLQERVYPLPHLLNQYGPELLDVLLGAGELDCHSHHVLTLEEPRA